MDIPFNKDITYLAKTNFRCTDQLFGIKRKDRRQHMYVLGKSGTGKSVLLHNMIIQNIENGEGLCVVDPHGELVEDVLKSIPEHRMKDVVYFNPADTDFHIGFNVLELQNPKYKHLVASGLMGIFTKIWANAWSARMEYILNNTILALLDTPGTTLLGVTRMLADKEYRQGIVDSLKDPVVKGFWVHEYEQWTPQFRNEAIAPIQNKVGQFLSSTIIRNVVGQGKSTIDIFDIMNSGKIFLVNVSKGRIGEDNSALLGGMLITKIQLAAMERVRIPENERKDFYMYVDEFQNFVTDSFANILSEARKYRLCLTIAHQYIAQLVTDNGSAVRDAVYGNVGTMIVFRIGAQDADWLEKEFDPEVTPEDLVSLPNYRVYMKLMVDGVTSKPFSASTLPPLYIEHEAGHVEKIIAESRARYTKPRKEVEKEIAKWSGMTFVDEDDITGEGSEVRIMGGGTGKKWEAVCSICGKKINVPFEPIAGKPIYCREDMEKVKNGEVAPVVDSNVMRSKELKSSSVLGDLGIEFAPEAGNKNKPMNNFVNTKPAFTKPIVKPVVNIPKPFVKPIEKPFIKPEVKSEVKPEIKKEFVKPVANIPKPINPPFAKKEPVVKIDDKPMNNDLKSLLNDVLADVIDKPIVEQVKKEENKIEDKKITEIPLDVLKGNDLKQAPHNPMLKKAATGEHSAGLRAAILGAMKEEKVEEIKVEEKKHEPIIIKEIEIKKEEKVEEKVEEKKEEVKKDDYVKKIPKEVPEDVLKKILEA